MMYIKIKEPYEQTIHIMKVNHETEDCYVCELKKDNSYLSVSKEWVLAKSDTIEELCDEFVYIKDGIVSQYLTIDFKFKKDDEFCALRNKLTANGIAEISKGISKYELENGELKFAIWTDKGLIYVAKMNENGELELI